MDSDELVNLPLGVGPWIKERARASVPPARRGVSASEDVEGLFLTPLAVPKGLPERQYFLFREPIQLDKSLADDREAAQEVYTKVKREVEDGITWLREKRGEDEYVRREKRESFSFSGSRSRGRKKKLNFSPLFFFFSLNDKKTSGTGLQPRGSGTRRLRGLRLRLLIPASDGNNDDVNDPILREKERERGRAESGGRREGSRKKTRRPCTHFPKFARASQRFNSISLSRLALPLSYSTQLLPRACRD